LLIDGTHAFVVGDYFTPNSGPHAGQLGPWSKIVTTLGFEPRSAFIKSLHVILGICWLTSLICFSLNLPVGRWMLLFCAVCSLWHFPVGTMISIVVIGFLLKSLMASPFVYIILKSMGIRSKSNPKAEQAAIIAANDWLLLIDGEKYAESWDKASQNIQNSVSKTTWVQTMESFIKNTSVISNPFGKNLSRELLAKGYYTSLPELPDGEYVVINFNSSFENRKSAIETITLMLESDGKWRVCSFFMR
jgi:hypothetical protein